MKSLRGKPVYYWHSSSEVLGVVFVRWRVMRRSCGGENTNKLEVGAVVSSHWAYSRLLQRKIDRGCRRGQALMRPYWDLYTSYANAYAHRRAIRRPSITQVRATDKRRDSQRRKRKELLRTAVKNLRGTNEG